MVFLITFIAAFFLGLSFWRRISNKTDLTFFDLVVSLAIGQILLTWILFIVSWIVGSIEPIQIIAILTIIAVAGIFDNTSAFKLPNFKTKEIITFFPVLIISAYFYFVYTHLFFWENGNLVAGWITVWGDWPSHMEKAASFAFGNNFPPQMPGFAGQLLSYPFLVDFNSAVLWKLSGDLTASFVVPGLLSVFLSLFLLAHFYKLISKNSKVAILALLLFLTNGGLGFIWQWRSNFFDSWTQIPSQNIQWVSVITSQILPQRGFTFALPLTLVVFNLLWQIYERKTSLRVFFSAGFLSSLLVLVHVHSLIIILILSTILFLFRPKPIRYWLIFAVTLLTFAAPFFWYFYHQSGLSSFVRFHPGWLATSLSDIPIFLLKNFGLMFIISLFGPLRLVTLLLFLLPNLFLFQPWDWDNSKIFAYWQLIAALGAAIFLHRLWKPLVILFIIILSLSGLHDGLLLLNTNKNKIGIFNESQFLLADNIKALTPPQSVFLTATNHDNPVTTLAGRKIMLGFPGWLWSYGINYYQRQVDFNSIKSGDESALKLLKEYKIDYILIGPAEINEKFNENFFWSNFPIIYSDKTYSLFKAQ